MAECSTMPHSAWLDCRVLRSPSRVRCAGLRPPLTAPTGRSSAHPTHSDFKRGFFSLPLQLCTRPHCISHTPPLPTRSHFIIHITLITSDHPVHSNNRE